MTHQYTYPEMKFLEELGFDPEISRAGKFGRFREEYRSLNVGRAVELVRQYVERHKAKIEKLSKK